MKAANKILMIRPASFGFNAETAVTNSFQQLVNTTDLQEKAAKEFDLFVDQLRSNQIEVIVADDTSVPVKPDAIFPNNWISFHPDGTVVLYPMQAKNRRIERRQDIIEQLSEKFIVKDIIDLTGYEQSQQFLEGTGSIVFDHKNKIAYASLSPRTNENVLKDLCTRLNYEPLTFTTHDRKSNEVYHTNVMMCIGDEFAIACLDAVCEKDRERLRNSLEKTKDLIEISTGQMERFAGNMLAVNSKENEQFFVMSDAAYRSLGPDQIKKLEQYCRIIHPAITTIETTGGGSARCMMAEVFLPSR